MKKTQIGIVGYGFVGSAVANSYPDSEILVHDPGHPDISVKISKIKNTCDAIFVCVPTPGVKSGQCDVSVLTNTIKKLRGYQGVVICKSTAPPLVYEKLEKSSKLKLAHVPEFLTQARAKWDYLNPHKIVVGCRKKIRAQVSDILMASVINFDPDQIEYCSIAEASFFKYLTNNMLAIKVSVCNEFQELCAKMNIDWKNVSKIAKTDYRLGSTHWDVPGPDGLPGFGGACFPKDTRAFQHMASENHVNTPILNTVLEQNDLRRG